MVKLEKAMKVCFISLLVNFFIGQAYSKPLEAEFIGHSSFHITDGGYVLMTDFPYKSGAYGSMTYEFDFLGTTGRVLSLITHRHDDHFAPVLFSEQRWKVLGPLEVTDRLAQDKVLKLEPKVTFGPMSIRPTKTRHGNTEHYSYLVEWHGRKLFFTGDTEDLSVLKTLPKLDGLFITPWFYRKAKLNDALPESEKIIIYHHKEKDIIPDCSRCIIPTQNQVISIRSRPTSGPKAGAEFGIK